MAENLESQCTNSVAEVSERSSDGRKPGGLVRISIISKRISSSNFQRFPGAVEQALDTDIPLEVIERITMSFGYTVSAPSTDRKFNHSKASMTRVFGDQGPLCRAI